MSEQLFQVIYLASLVACIAIVALVFFHWGPVDNHICLGIVPGVAGFSVFPVMNTLIAVAAIGFIVLSNAAERYGRRHPSP